MPHDCPRQYVHRADLVPPPPPRSPRVAPCPAAPLPPRAHRSRTARRRLRRPRHRRTGGPGFTGGRRAAFDLPARRSCRATGERGHGQVPGDRRRFARGRRPRPAVGLRGSAAPDLALGAHGHLVRPVGAGAPQLPPDQRRERQVPGDRGLLARRRRPRPAVDVRRRRLPDLGLPVRRPPADDDLQLPQRQGPGDRRRLAGQRRPGPAVVDPYIPPNHMQWDF